MADFDINPFEKIKEKHKYMDKIRYRYYATYERVYGYEVKIFEDVEDIELDDALVKIGEFDVFKTKEEAKEFLDLDDIKP